MELSRKATQMVDYGSVAANEHPQLVPFIIVDTITIFTRHLLNRLFFAVTMIVKM